MCVCLEIAMLTDADMALTVFSVSDIV